MFYGGCVGGYLYPPLRYMIMQHEGMEKGRRKGQVETGDGKGRERENENIST